MGISLANDRSIKKSRQPKHPPTPNTILIYSHKRKMRTFDRMSFPLRGKTFGRPAKGARFDRFAKGSGSIKGGSWELNETRTKMGVALENAIAFLSRDYLHKLWVNGLLRILVLLVTTV